jgi:carotenoid cleavage dioxygenase-like enzyme
MNPLLPIDGVLPPDLQGTLLRIGPGARYGLGRAPGAGALAESDPGGADPAGAAQDDAADDEAYAGALHAIELRDGTAVSYLTSPSAANANVFWQAGKVLALAESGLPQQFSRLLQPEEFDGGLRVPIASHVHRDALTGGRILFGVEQGTETASPFLRLGEWDAAGALTHQMEVELERATWQHDLGVTARHIAFIESPTEFSEFFVEEGSEETADVAVPYRWTPGAPGWVGVVERSGDGSAVRWASVDPCLVTHVLHAYDEEPVGRGGGAGGGDRADAGGEAVVLYVCRYDVPEQGQPVNLDVSVVGPAGIGMSLIGGGLPLLERWRIEGDKVERTQVDDRMVEYPTSDPLCEGGPFRYGYGVEVAPNWDRSVDREVDHLGLLRFDVARDEVATWNPGQYRTASEPLFVRAVDGRSDDEGWLLTVVYDAARGASDIYVLDASSFGRRPQAVIHLPESVALPFRSHGTWISADQYR